MKKTLKIIGIVLLAVLVLAGGYVAYVFAAYHRIEDNQKLAVVSGQTQTARAGETYRIACWNIGFGAYEDDYSFFMDGGTESWAWSEERLLQNLDEIGAVIESLDSDITLLQEVDFDSTRTYHVNEADLLRNYHGLEADTDSAFAVNYDSPFLFYPFVRPHGTSRSGLLTVSSLTVESALRRSLPVETGFTKLLDLDRCYSVTRIPVDNGKTLCLYDLHLSAYTSDGKIADEQLEMLLADMQQEYENGNYVVGGGDFNKDLLGNSGEIFGVSTEGYTWAQPIKTELFEGKNLTLVAPLDENDPQPSCRNADAPYHEGQLLLTVDGFLVSDNVTVSGSLVYDTGFAYSDHQPVVMTFTLEP